MSGERWHEGEGWEEQTPDGIHEWGAGLPWGGRSRFPLLERGGLRWRSRPPTGLGMVPLLGHPLSPQAF